MAKVFVVRVYEDHFIVDGDSVKVPIAVTEDARLVPILKGLADFKPKVVRKPRGPNKPKALVAQPPPEE